MKQEEINKKKRIAKFADSSQNIAKSGVAQTNPNLPEVSIVNERMWILVALGFAILCILSWLNEILDLPHFLTGAIKTPFNWQESIVEMALIIIVGLFTVSVVIRNIAENKKKERLLQRYRYELEIKINGQTSELLRVNEELRTDITKRKKAEDTLRKSEEKYRYLIENLREGIWVIDKDSYTTFVNPRMAEMLGYTTDEMIGKHLFSFMDKRGVEIARGLVNRRKRGIKEQHDFEFLRKDGTRLYATLATGPIFDGKGNYSGAIAGVVDISRRKRAEDALRLSEESYSLAQRVANIGSWDWDIPTGSLQWSEKIEPMFGFGRGEFGGTYEAFLECVHPEDRQHVVDSVNACIEKGRDYDIEHRIIWPDGTIRWVSETGNVIHDENNKAIRMLGVVQDITERKHAEEVLKRDKETFERLVDQRTHELFKTKAELDKAKRLSDLGTLAATVAHELRNPLVVIKTALYNIRKKRKSSSIDKHLDNIEKKVSESSQIINNLLGYSRIKIPSYERIQIYDILNECITSTKKRFYRENVSIVKNFKSTKKKFIEADPLQIREIFNNILTNAYQSVSNRKGKIEISTRDDAKGSIKISFKDNGMGIDKEDLQRIFEPFFTRKSKGTGLGLTICNELVNLHGGKIDIESKKGKGTSVTVSLPIKGETK